MTSEDMKYEVQARIELLPGLNKGDLEDKEMNFYLNAAQDRVVVDLCSRRLTQLLTELYDYKTFIKGIGYEDDGVVSRGIPNAMYWTFVNAATPSIPFDFSDYMFLVNGNVVITTPTGVENIKCVPIDKKDSLDFAVTSKNKVWFEYPKIFIDSDRIVVIVDNDTTFPESTGLRNLNVTFIKKPTAIDVTDTVDGNCELRAILHDDVIAEAVKQITNEKRLKPNTEGTE